MSICFLSNKGLTVPFSDLGKRLVKAGEKVVWIAPSRRWSEWLVAEGWDKADVLTMPDYAQEWRDLPLEQARAELAEIEGEAPDTISNVIQICRNLRRSPPKLAYGYLAVARRHIEKFLEDRNVEIVLGEATWGLELAVYLLCRRRGIPMLLPASVRIPGDRCYFADSFTADLYQFRDPTDADHETAERFLREWRSRPVEPQYMWSQKGGYKPFEMRWLRELAIAVFRPELDRDDETLLPLRARFEDRVKRFVNSTMVEWRRPYRRDTPDERYVLFPVHHQPESSIDGFGSLNSNQMALIESLSRIIPASHKLWVKEHRTGLGDRPLSWYKRILRLPNVRLIDPYLNIFPLLRGADLVVTISGTAGYEAALLGVPSVGLTPIFFSELLLNKPTSRSHPLEWRMQTILSDDCRRAYAESSVDRATAFLARVYANTFVGNACETEASPTRRAEASYMVAEAEVVRSLVQTLRDKERLRTGLS